MPLRIEYLVDHRDLVPVIAEWHWKDDGERTPLDFWVRAHSEEAQGTEVPSCSVALLHGRPVGSVSLIERNMDTHPELSPWLAALFVVPEVQGRGIGSALTRHCEDRAAELGHSMLYLYAEDAEGFYARLGWHVRAVEQYEGSAVSIMQKRVGPTPLHGSNVGDRIVAVLGAPAARELLEALEQSDADRAALIGRLYARDDARWIAELLMDLEDEVGEIARLRLIDELRRTLGDGEGRNDWA